jgi:hypothetical protein
MKSPAEALPYVIKTHDLKEAALIQCLQYDDVSHTFRLPLVLMPKEKATFTLKGFCSAVGVAAEPIKIEFQVSGEELCKADRDKFEAETKNPRLLRALEFVQSKRAELQSLAERVQTLSLSQQDGRFTELTAQSASFKWQSPNQ